MVARRRDWKIEPNRAQSGYIDSLGCELGGRSQPFGGRRNQVWRESKEKALRSLQFRRLPGRLFLQNPELSGTGREKRGGEEKTQKRAIAEKERESRRCLSSFLEEVSFFSPVHNEEEKRGMVARSKKKKDARCSLSHAIAAEDSAKSRKRGRN